jgi:peptidoglycan-N-acetylglucosamine deacetylase
MFKNIRIRRAGLFLSLFILLCGCAGAQNDEAGYLKKGRKYVESQKYDQAVTEYKSALGIDPASAEAYFMLGEIYFYQSNINRFRTQVLNFIAKYKHHPAYPKLADVDYNAHDETILMEGIKNYQKALENNLDRSNKAVDNGYIHYQLGWAYLIQHKDKESREEFNLSLNNNNDPWGAGEPLAFMDYLQKKGLTKDNVYYQGNPLSKKVTLTFDDGPNDVYTPQILAILDKYKVKATFFMLGDAVQYHPAMAQKIVKAGHSIGNHSYSHMNLYKNRVPIENVLRDIDKSAQIITKVTGKHADLYRSPYNYLDDQLIHALRERKYFVVSWTYAPGDWEKISGEKIALRVLSNVTSGSIFLLHDGGGNRSQTVKALPIIIEGLRKQGYEFVDLPELLNLGK